MLIDALGEVLEALRTLLESLFGLLVRRRSEEIASTELAVPIAQTAEVLFLFIKLGRGEFLDADLFVDLPIELRALRQEFLPLLLAVCREERFEALRHRITTRDGVEDEGFAVGALDEIDRSSDRGEKVATRGDGPGGLLKRDRTDSA